MTITDQMLSAYLEGELTDAEARSVATSLETDHALRDRLERLRAVDTEIRAAFSRLSDAPTPQAILDAARRYDQKASGADVDPLSQRRGRRAPMTARHGAIAAFAALAAGVALVMIDFGGRDTLDPIGETLAGRIAPDGALHAALETTPSASEVDLGGYALSPVFTFVSTGGEVCRAYTLTSPDATVEAAACRVDGAWRVQVAADATMTADPANGRQTAEGDPSSTIDGTPLGAEAERALIAAGWTR